ncbi:MAG: PEP-CTERM sorting domain-containing protein [Cyanobacteria bacterium J06626_18]
MTIRVRSLQLIGVSLLSGVAVLGVRTPVEAASITADVTVEIVDGDLLPGETFFGTLTYDDSFLTGSGFEILTVGAGLEAFEFTYVGPDLETPAVYTLSDEVDFPAFPELGFTDGGLTGLVDGLLYEAEISSDASFFFDGQFFGTDEFSTGSFNDGSVTYAVAAVPEPASILGMAAVGLLGLLNYRRRRCA